MRLTGGHVLGEVGEAVPGRGGEVAGHGEHRDAAVLELDLAEAVELLLVGVLEEALGIEEAQGRLRAELLREAAIAELELLGK